VLAAAATGFQSALSNQPDEAPLTNANSSTTSSGHTAGPDLESTTLVATKDAFGNISGYVGTYAFDEAVDGPSAGALRLYDADGTELVCVAASAGTVAAGTEMTVTCTSYQTATAGHVASGTAASAAQLSGATLGTVDDGAVNASDAGPDNVEGASGVTRSGF